MKKNIIMEVVNGNGNKFTVKEILSAHIRDGKIFENYVRLKFEEGAGKIAVNRFRSKIALWGISVIIVALIGEIVVRNFFIP